MSKILNFIRPSWKAVMPLLVFVASALIDQYTSADAPSGWKAFITAVVTSVLVYLKANTAPVTRRDQARLVVGDDDRECPGGGDRGDLRLDRLVRLAVADPEVPRLARDRTACCRTASRF